MTAHDAHQHSPASAPAPDQHAHHEAHAHARAHHEHQQQEQAHDAHAHHTMDASWRTAAMATLHCLTGCAIGEVLGMVIGTSIGLPEWWTVALAVLLAFVFGYALTMRGVLRAGVPLRTAFRIALAADTVSIAVMEIVDNAVMLSIPGAMEAGVTSVVFWASLAFALAVAFVVTTPVNRWLIARGKGHAVVHQYHH